MSPQGHQRPDSRSVTGGHNGGKLDVVDNSSDISPSHQHLAYQTFLDSLNEVVFQTDLQGNWTFLNGAWTEITGFDVADTLGTNFLDYVHPDELEATLASFAAVTSGESNQCHHEGRYRTADGGWRWVELRVGLMFDDEGQVVGNAGTIFDIEERRNTQELLAEQSHILELVARDAPLADIFATLAGLIARRTGGIVGISRSLESQVDGPFDIGEDLLKSHAETAPGPNQILAVTPDESVTVRLSVLQLEELATSRGLKNHSEAPITSTATQRELGNFIVYHSNLSKLDDNETALVRRCSYLAAIAIERLHAREEAQRQANRDPLTGLPNRTVMVDRLEQSLAAAQRHGKLAAVLLMDIDHFKIINDTLGHETGDEALRQIAARMTFVLRDIDSVCRLGGDEFVIVLPELAEAGDAANVARKVLRAVERPLALNGESARLSASIGVALYPGYGDAASLLKQADVAMYRAKRFRGSHAVFEAAADEDRLTSLGLAGELREAIEAGRLVVHFQPKIDLHTGLVVGVEALVRWRHDDRGLMLPDQFIPIAETTGLIGPLTLWVLRNAAWHARRWSALGVTLEVNLSAHDLHDPELPAAIEQTLASCNLSAKHLMLEITESAVMADPKSAIEAMERLSSTGVSFALDDFGAGYSSLTYLKNLPVRILKIDRSFVSNLAVDERDVSIVACAIDLAHNLKMKVIGEGVETRQVCRLLGELGCDYAQGNFVAPPMPASEVLDWLLHHQDNANLARRRRLPAGSWSLEAL